MSFSSDTYRKNPKISDIRNIFCNQHKSGKRWLFLREMHPKDAEWIANSVDPNQTARSRLILVCTVCPDLSVRKLRSITVFMTTLLLRSSSVSAYYALCIVSIWANACRNQQKDLWTQQRLRSAWASAQSDQHPPSLIRVFAVRLEKPWILSYQHIAQWRLLGGRTGRFFFFLFVCFFVIEWLICTDFYLWAV